MAQKETVEVRPPRETDDFGDPIGEAPPWEPINGCTVVPRESHDYHERGPVIIQGFLIRFPSTATLSDQHEIRVRGEVHQVDGGVGDYLKKGKLVYTTRVN